VYIGKLGDTPRGKRERERERERETGGERWKSERGRTGFAGIIGSERPYGVSKACDDV